MVVVPPTAAESKVQLQQNIGSLAGDHLHRGCTWFVEEQRSLPNVGVLGHDSDEPGRLKARAGDSGHTRILLPHLSRVVYVNICMDTTTTTTRPPRSPLPPALPPTPLPTRSTLCNHEQTAHFGFGGMCIVVFTRYETHELTTQQTQRRRILCGLAVEPCTVQSLASQRQSMLRVVRQNKISFQFGLVGVGQAPGASLPLSFPAHPGYEHGVNHNRERES